MSTQVRYRFDAELTSRRNRRSRHRVGRAPPTLPVRAPNLAAFPHMRYARTVPLVSRGDAVACRKRAVLVEAARAFDGLVLSIDRPFALWALLDRHGFMPMNDSDLTPVVTLLHELALRLGWDRLEHHPAPALGDGAVVVRRDDADLRLSPIRGEWLLRVLVAGNGVQVAAYTRDLVN